MVNGEQLRSQGKIGLPFTDHCLPNALRSALSASYHGGSPKPLWARVFAGVAKVAATTKKERGKSGLDNNFGRRLT
jgi:hypothetical protein